MAKIIAICGKICSGKTCYAKWIKEKEKAVILSCDEVTKALFDNDLGDRHDEMAQRIQRYLLKKAAELVKNGCNVILDWGFWSRESRKSLREFCRARSLPLEWRYACVSGETWQKYIDERNRSGENDTDYYLDEGLMQKLLRLWEPPAQGEMDVLIPYDRE